MIETGGAAFLQLFHVMFRSFFIARLGKALAIGLPCGMPFALRADRVLLRESKPLKIGAGL
jgi:hypothetical protein